MPTTTNFKFSDGSDFGNSLITKEYLMSVYPQIAANLITPELWTWGRNSNGNLGDNTTTQRSTPVTTFPGGANWKQIDCGGYFTAAIKTDGTLWTWGQNTYGNLGDNTTTQRNTPVTTFAGGTDWKQVNCGYHHVTAIKTNGTLWTWGRNSNGNLGDNTTTNRSTPVTTFPGESNWKYTNSGSAISAAIKTDGTLWTWGRNYDGNLGDNTTTRRLTPVTTFSGGTNWKQVSCAYDSMGAIKTDGTLWLWGRNVNGALGDNTTVTRSTPVTTFAGGTNWKQIGSCGGSFSAIKTDGTLWLWGRNVNGALGDNTTVTRSIPVTTFAGGTNWKSASSANNGQVSSAIKTDGTLWIWGYDGGNGTLGNNVSGFVFRSTPITTFAGGTNWKQVTSGYYTVAIKTSQDP